MTDDWDSVTPVIGSPTRQRGRVASPRPLLTRRATRSMLIRPQSQMQLGRSLALPKIIISKEARDALALGASRAFARSLDNDVVAQAAVEDVEAESADEHVIAVAAEQHVTPLAADEDVIAVAAISGELDAAGCQA